MCSHVCVCTNVCVYMFMVVFWGVHAVHVCASRDVMLFRVRMCVCVCASMLMHAYFARARMFISVCLYVSSCMDVCLCMYVHACAPPCECACVCLRAHALYV